MLRRGIRWPVNWRRFLHILHHLKIKASINGSSATSRRAQRRAGQDLITAVQKSTCWDSHAHTGWTQAGDLAVVINPGFNQPAGKRARFNPPWWTLLRRTSNKRDAPLSFWMGCSVHSSATSLGTVLNCQFDSNDRSLGQGDLLKWNPSFRTWMKSEFKWDYVGLWNAGECQTNKLHMDICLYCLAVLDVMRQRNIECLTSCVSPPELRKNLKIVRRDFTRITG